MIKKITFFLMFGPLLVSSEFIDTLKVPKNFEISIFAKKLRFSKANDRNFKWTYYSWLQKRH